VTVFDAHCDTVQKICDFGGNLVDNLYHIDLNRLNTFEGYIQIFAAFIDKQSDALSPFKRCNQLIDKYFYEIGEAKEKVCHCLNSNDINLALNKRRRAALLSIEGGEALEGKIENLNYFYKRGVRAITLTWNYSNEISGGISEINSEGLTDFGHSVVLKMNELGMLIDVSHISERGFWDVIEQTKMPIAATHSNAKKLCPHLRNLSDEQICAIIKNGGCIGINLYSEFLNGDKCSIKNVLEHIEYILALGGENNIGLGCDFDGMSKLPEGIDGVQDIYKLFDEMRRCGYSDLLIKKIASDNFLNLCKKILL